MRLRVELTVEPFVAGTPGPHVQAALDAIVAAATAAGATRLSLQIELT